MIYVGTSGYSYADWHGPFFPEDLPARSRLEYYLSRFHFVEINATYYRMPSARMIGGIADRCRAAVTAAASVPFVVKLPGSLTHERPENTTELDHRASLFGAALAPLVAAARQDPLVPSVLAQFPFSFRYTPENRTYLARLGDRLREMPFQVFVEFRQREWQRESVHAGLAERDLIPVTVDLPDLAGLPNSLDGTVSARFRILYLRCHGRNTATWWTGDATTRYDYRYSADELSRIADFVSAFVSKDPRASAYVAFNNHFRGNAAANAEELRQLLMENGVEAE